MRAAEPAALDRLLEAVDRRQLGDTVDVLVPEAGAVRRALDLTGLREALSRQE